MFLTIFTINDSTLFILRKLSEDGKQGMKYFPARFSMLVKAKAKNINEMKTFIERQKQKIQEDENFIKSIIKKSCETIGACFIFFIKIRTEFLSNLETYLFRSNSKERTENVSEMQLDSVAIKEFIDKYFDLIVHFKEKFQTIFGNIKNKNECDFDSDIIASNSMFIEMNNNFHVLFSETMKKLKNENISGLFKQFTASGCDILNEQLIFVN